MSIIKQINFNKDKNMNSTLIVVNERGSALFVVIVAMAILTIIAAISMMSSRDEIKIAGNDRRYQITKSEADGATEMASELLEQNLACAPGFTNLDRGSLIKVVTPAFYQNDRDSVRMPYSVFNTDNTPDSSDSVARDFYLPLNFTKGDPHTNFTMGGYTRFAYGAAIQDAAGYEGKGKGSGSGGGLKIYEIFTQRKGELNSEAL